MMMEKSKYIALFEKYLRNEISEQERYMLLLMLRSDKRVDDLFYNELKNAKPELDKDTASRIYANIRAKTSSEKKATPAISLWKRAMRWAAIFVLPILSALGAYYFASNGTFSNNTPVVIATSAGEKAEITLADGSRVWINSSSSITYDSRFNRRERRVQLTGEAYFEVAENERRSFIVETDEMDIRVQGTNFNVRSHAEDEQVSVVLLEGKVKVSTPTQAMILTENQRATFSRTTHQLTTDYVYASNFTAWKRGHLFFSNQSFEEIARTLSRAFGVEIRFASEELKTIRFSGTLCNRSIRNALDILILTSPMRYEMSGTVIELHYRR
jgi:ferric-dicitrate binding protein FerR (iron transport regulator)